jgi:hypothetical protein
MSSLSCEDPELIYHLLLYVIFWRRKISHREAYWHFQCYPFPLHFPSRDWVTYRLRPWGPKMLDWGLGKHWHYVPLYSHTYVYQETGSLNLSHWDRARDKEIPWGETVLHWVVESQKKGKGRKPLWEDIAVGYGLCLLLSSMPRALYTPPCVRNMSCGHALTMCEWMREENSDSSFSSLSKLHWRVSFNSHVLWIIPQFYFSGFLTLWFKWMCHI